MYNYKTEESIQNFIKTALQEDVGEGDHTSLSTIPKEAKGKARLLVKEAGILAGVEIAEKIFKTVDSELIFSPILKEGDPITQGLIAFTVEGKAQSILKSERLVLNCMQRMSGIATYTKELVNLLKGLDTKLLDTRKTTPNFRICEKWATQIGGAINHRYGLFDMILIKDNHVDYAGGISKAISKANEYLKARSKNLSIEIEVRNLEELEEVLAVGNVQRIMLDNFSIENLERAVKRINKKFITEAAGGINEKTVRQVAETGVDFISCGALTHHVNSLDLSLKAFF